VVGYLREYAVSLFHLIRLARRVHRTRPADVVIACNPPDVLPLLARLLGRPKPAVIFDHHDLSPELFERRLQRKGVLHRLLLRLERQAFRTADVVMSSNDSYAEIARTRGGVPADRLFAVRNAPDPQRIFPVQPDPELKRGSRYLVVWAGSMTQRSRCAHLIDAAEEIVKGRARDDVRFVLLGSGIARQGLIEEVHARGLADAVDLPGPVGDELLRQYYSTADVCVSVDEQNDMNHLSTVTKVLDYMAMGRPVVQFPLKEMSAVCGDASAYARNGDPSDLAEQIVALLDAPDRRERLGARARERMLDGRMWPDQVPQLFAAIERALEVRDSRARAPGRA
jgi:glycosyltransferase involved in cell wall biosynthesis